MACSAPCPPATAAADADAAELLACWDTYGYVLLPAALPAAATAALAEQLRALLLPEGLDLAAPASLPAGGARRVFEAAPPSAATGAAAWDGAWRALASCAPLARALDALLGAGAWELPLNGAASPPPVRHVYAPCTAPERPPGSGSGPSGSASAVGSGSASASAVGSGSASAVAPSLPPPLPLPLPLPLPPPPPPRSSSSSPCPPPRPCPFLPVAAWARAAPAPAPAPAAAWAPVSRRRHVGTGWHLDIGPGVSPEAARAPPRAPGAPCPDAHRAGAVLLLALSPWAAGEGGTAVLPGSHRWVEGELRARAAAGAPLPSHQQLNLHFAREMRARTEAGRVLLPACACGAALAGLAARGSGSGGGGGAPAHACSYAALVAAQALGAPGTFVAPPASAAGGAAPAPPPAILCQQAVCPSGSILLLHPLALHSGTLNLSAAGAVRLMLNGMARSPRAT
jgi:hypothetical protein